MSGWSRYGEIVGAVPSGVSRRAAQRLDAALSREGEGIGVGRALRLAGALVAALVIAWLWLGRADDERGTIALHSGASGKGVELADDGRLWLESHTRIELAADEHGATVDLYEGEVELAVHARPGARWVVRVDGHAVEAVGTRFRVRRTGDAPDVSVEEGVVVVTGPAVPAGGLRVSAGEAVDPHSPSPAEVRVEPELPDVAPVEEAPPTVPAIESPPPAPPPAPRPAARRGREPPWVAEFRADVASGELQRASTRLPRTFPDDGAVLAPDEYLDAGDALAAAGDSKRADASYRAACRSGWRKKACGVATLRRALARSKAGELDGAIELADEYLEHEPDGTLAREAVGRRMDWNLALGRRELAQRDAQTYLDRWPDGARAGAARRILAR